MADDLRIPSPDGQPRPAAGTWVGASGAAAEPPDTGASETLPTPYLEFDRAGWSGLRANTPLTLDAAELARLRGLGERIDLDEVREVYLPLSRLLNLYVRAVQRLRRAVTDFVAPSTDKAAGIAVATTPFVIGIAGSVAVGKSTTARLLRALLARWPDHPTVELVTTDGFLYPNAVLARRGQLHRKGFPESYDQRALVRFVAAVKAGAAVVAAPVYSHLAYDVLPNERVLVRRPDILLVEGLNVLQPSRPRPDGRPRLAVSDYFDFSLYVDARAEDVRSWYVDRFLALRDSAFQDPASYFHRYAALDDVTARGTALRIWREINEPNLVENIQPTRGRATLIIAKGPDHAVRRIRLRKL